ncbi:MAG: RsmD family RNA methyltransferase [Paraprevotella sp.]|nr:RsmD family RNA methyltransferase [Paraprevotella sp.]
MRVITGKYKGRHFDVPRSFKARPTTDFAKENLFNVLNGYIDFDEEPVALDLFAGTGSITLELLSRGCSKVVSVEKDSQHFSFIVQVLNYLKDKSCFPIRTDVFRYIERCHEQFDFIFADPPYALPNLEELPELILNKGILKADGLFVLEHGKSNDFTGHPLFIEQRTYGSVNFSFFKAKETTSEQ